jgi:hypothetical protein
MPAASAATASRDLTAELAFLTRALKRPRCASGRVGSRNEPVRRRGPMRSIWPLACSARWQLVTRTAGKVASGRPIPGPQEP